MEGTNTDTRQGCKERLIGHAHVLQPVIEFYCKLISGCKLGKVSLQEDIEGTFQNDQVLWWLCLVDGQLCVEVIITIKALPVD